MTIRALFLLALPLALTLGLTACGKRAPVKDDVASDTPTSDTLYVKASGMVQKLGIT